MERSADLHVHTNFSDGTFTPEEVMSYAQEQGLSCIAIADHDTVEGLPIAIKLQQQHGIELIPAVEMTAQEDKKELHILGYFIDWQSKKLRGILKQICDGRQDRIYHMTEKLNEHGINADAGEIIKYARVNAVSRLHVARYLVEKGYVSSLKAAFDKYIGDGKPCYISRFRFSSKEVINTIKDARGIAVIAHPGLNNVAKALPVLVENGIDGVEVFHTDHTKATTEKLLEFTAKHNLLITGGSDCHGANKKQVLMGTVKLPYKYVEILKEYAEGKKR